MKFKELLETDNQRNQAYVDFEKELTGFRNQYNNYDFDLNYSDNEHLIILVENVGGYNQEIHVQLCRTFNVKLVYVNRLTQQTARGYYLTIEYIYKDSCSEEQELKWEDIRWV